MVEPEVAWNDSAANMRLQEDLLTYLVQRVLERRRAELTELERDISKLEAVKVPFIRLDYGDAVALVQKKVNELLGNERFNQSFQIGMLASFESFLETAKLKM